MDYKFFADLGTEATIPVQGILSRVLQKDDSVNITLFGMAAGEEISSHSAPTPAILTFSMVKRLCNSARILSTPNPSHSFLCLHVAPRNLRKVTGQDVAYSSEGGAHQPGTVPKLIRTCAWLILVSHNNDAWTP